ncbi:hypothetical protein [Micromonospora sp. NPDC049662]|uniref:hypothetical protein n=1 Tax=Micromonospora sp. NPDC049662 TaxID=3155397 RepID=UPI00343FFDE9
MTDQEMRAALDRIIQRRDDIDDPNRYQLSDDPRDVLAYLRKHSRGMPEHVRRADVEDGLVLRVWLWWDGEAAELWLLDRADELAMNRRSVGARLGVATGQGLVDRRVHKRAMLSRATGIPAPAPASSARGREEWIAAHRRAVQAIASTLVEHRELADEEAAESLIEVRRDLHDDVCTPAGITVIDWAVTELAAVPAVAALPDSHPLRQAITAWAPLAAAFRRIPDR